MRRHSKGKAPVRPRSALSAIASTSSTSQNAHISQRSRTTGLPSTASSRIENMLGIPLNYLDMMKDIHVEANRLDHSRPLKKRKTRSKTADVGTSKSVEDQSDNASIVDLTVSAPASGAEDVVDVVTKDHQSEDSLIEYEDEEDENVEWENVELQQEPSIHSEGESGDEASEITVALNKRSESSTPRRASRNITVLSKEEKLHRQLVHKIHLTCLMHHLWFRNCWVNDFEIRRLYSTVLTPTIMQELFPPNQLSLTLKSRKFLDGLRHAITFWNKKFRVSLKYGCGVSLVSWKDIYSKNRQLDQVYTQSGFRRRLIAFKGSRDMAAQAFCALLRSVSVDTRLVCSLQPLDFRSNIPIGPKNGDDNDSQVNPYTISEYPIYWVEAWDQYMCKWVSVDPVVLQHIEVIRRQQNSRCKFEPPLSYSTNILRYVIAFDKEGYACDVTRRYAQYYNAKTRKKRITSTPNGQEWWEKLMKIYAPFHLTQRDVIEQEDLATKVAYEAIPTSIQDFKGHPLFVLERHLKNNEILIDDKVPCGRLSIKGSKTESIYRRQDVRKVLSSQAWYKQGRVIITGCQPVKHLSRKSRSYKLRYPDDEVENYEGDGDLGIVSLYSEDQTELYISPPIENGVVPKNAYGNIDVYTPSMVPAGGVHLPFPNIAIAARLVEIDYADAVTGFDFVNRRMSPRIQGIVIAKKGEEAVMAVYNQLLEEQEEEDRNIRIANALRKWRRYLLHLQIKDRLNRRHGHVEGEGDIDEDEINESVGIDYDETQKDEIKFEETYEDGGFLPEDAENDHDIFEVDSDYDGQGGFIVEDESEIHSRGKEMDSSRQIQEEVESVEVVSIYDSSSKEQTEEPQAVPDIDDSSFDVMNSNPPSFIVDEIQSRIFTPSTILESSKFSMPTQNMEDVDSSLSPSDREPEPDEFFPDSISESELYENLDDDE